jgi:hypothetical protein
MDHEGVSRWDCRARWNAHTICRQNRIMLRDGTSRDAHAQGASHYHVVKAYPGPGWESMAAQPFDQLRLSLVE